MNVAGIQNGSLKPQNIGDKHDSDSLWLRIPFGFTHHGEVLIEGEGDERTGCLSCDGGQLLN